MAYRDSVETSKARLNALLEERAELDARIAATRRAISGARRRRWWERLVNRPRWGIALGIEVVIVAAIVLLQFVPMAGRTCAGPSRVDATRIGAQSIRAAAMIFIFEEGACPAVGDLVGAGYLDTSRRITDAWGRPFRIQCAGDDVIVGSAGPDGVFHTKDDIGGDSKR